MSNYFSRSIIGFRGYDRKAKGQKLEARITIDELKDLRIERLKSFLIPEFLN